MWALLHWQKSGLKLLSGRHKLKTWFITVLCTEGESKKSKSKNPDTEQISPRLYWIEHSHINSIKHKSTDRPMGYYPLLFTFFGKLNFRSHKSNCPLIHQSCAETVTLKFKYFLWMALAQSSIEGDGVAKCKINHSWMTAVNCVRYRSWHWLGCVVLPHLCFVSHNIHQSAPLCDWTWSITRQTRGLVGAKTNDNEKIRLKRI